MPRKSTPSKSGSATPPKVVEEPVVSAPPTPILDKGGKKNLKTNKPVAIPEPEMQKSEVQVSVEAEVEAEVEADADANTDDSSSLSEKKTNTKLSQVEHLELVLSQLDKENNEDIALLTMLKERVKIRKTHITFMKSLKTVAVKKADKDAKKAKKSEDSEEGSKSKRKSGVFKLYPVNDKSLEDFIVKYHQVPSSSIRKKTGNEIPCIETLTRNSDGKIVVSTAQLQTLWCSVVELLSLKELNEKGKSTSFIKYDKSPFQVIFGNEFDDDSDEKRLTYKKFYGQISKFLDKSKPYVQPETQENVAV